MYDQMPSPIAQAEPHPPFVPERRSHAGHGGDQRRDTLADIVDRLRDLDPVEPQADPHREGCRQQDRRGAGDPEVAIGVPVNELHATLSV